MQELLRGSVRLTALSAADASVLAPWYEDGAFSRMLDARASAPRAESDLVRWIEETNSTRDGFLFGIRPLEAETLLGFVQVGEILWPQGNGWITLAVGPGHQAQGVGAEALRLALRFAFDEVNLRRLQLTVFSYNTRAIALYERLGFRPEGAFREFLRRDGQAYDLLLYGLLEREWRESSRH